jgi:rubrerythrin
VSSEFNGDEILRMAERIERNGIKFYSQAAKGMKEERGAELLRNLAAMESEHEKTFARMRAELTEQERKATVFDPENRNTAYLYAWADGHVFDIKSDPIQKLSANPKVEEIYRLAIGMEKDSIVFYLGMKDVVPKHLGREKVDAIVREEMYHLATLSRELETLRHQPI